MVDKIIPGEKLLALFDVNGRMDRNRDLLIKDAPSIAKLNLDKKCVREFIRCVVVFIPAEKARIVFVNANNLEFRKAVTLSRLYAGGSIDRLAK